MKHRIALELICASFIILFTYAAASKLFDIEKFRILISQSPLLTDIAPFVSLFIPISEIVVAICLAIPRFRLVALFASFSLMVIFTSYILSIVLLSEHIPCSCGGVLQKLTWKEHLVFNIGFILLAFIGIILSTNQSTPDSTQQMESIRS